MIIFPPSIRDRDPDRPLIIFRNAVAATTNDTVIAMPIPQSIQFSDGASYNNQELGLSGSAILNAGRSTSITDAGTNLAAQVKSSMPKDLRSLVALTAGSSSVNGPARSAIGIATGTTLNKNIVTEFSGVQTRSFSFQFKLISTSLQESQLIRKIVDSFRIGLYPEGNSLQLRFPPTWYINFKKNGKDIGYLPKIFQTYLTSMATSYNSSMNMFHEDGAPVEVDVQVSFMETRALTKADILKLESGPYKKGDFEEAFRLPNAAETEAAAKTAAATAVFDQTGGSAISTLVIK